MSDNTAEQTYAAPSAGAEPQQQQQQQNSNLEHALGHAARGWKVFPLHTPVPGKPTRCSCGKADCPNVGKHPRWLRDELENGLKNATTDPDVIRRWWNLWPEANIAVATGAASGIFVVDVDPRHGGDETLAKLEQQHGRPPETVEALTGGGGRHIVYRHPGFRVANDASGKFFGPGVDVRGDGGYVVVPPSLHASGRTYEWEVEHHPDDVPVADAPAWVLDALRPTASARKPAPATATAASPTCAWDDIPAPVSYSGPIIEGNRNATLAGLAGSLRHRGLSPDALEAALLAENAQRCRPPLPDDEVRRIAASIGRYAPAEDYAATGGDAGKANAKERKKSQADLLVEVAGEAVLFNDGEHAYATVQVGDHRENHPVRSKGFRDWLARRFYLGHGKAPAAQAMQDGLGVITAKALYEGPREPVFVRTARHGRDIYLDLANDQWQAVRVTAEGWTVVSDPPVRFLRRSGMEALPVPVPGGSIEELRKIINAPDDAQWHLIVAWLVGSLRPEGPYPILVISGEQGSAKSTTSRMIRGLIDPNLADLRAVPKDEGDIIVAASNSWVTAYDNISGMSPWLSDALCRLATGAGFGKRTLYTDGEETLFRATRPILLNGIEELSSRPDLRERSLAVNLPTIPETARRPERVVQEQYREAKPRILGALLDAVVTAIRNVATVTLEKLPRMADFAEWVVAAEPSLGWAGGSFMGSYYANLRHGEAAAMESSPIGSAILAMAESWCQWTGTVKQLLQALSGDTFSDEQARRRQDWPRTAQGLSGQLRRLQPALRTAGVTVTFGEHTKHGTPVTIALDGADAAARKDVSDSDNWLDT